MSFFSALTGSASGAAAGGAASGGLLAGASKFLGIAGLGISAISGFASAFDKAKYRSEWAYKKEALLKNPVQDITKYNDSELRILGLLPKQTNSKMNNNITENEDKKSFLTLNWWWMVSALFGVGTVLYVLLGRKRNLG